MYLTTTRNNNYTNFFNDMFMAPFFSTSRSASNVRNMKTNVQENENGYVLEMELPGYKKEDIQAELKDGYLTISATKAVNNDEQDNNGKYIRKERFTGSLKRSFYVGEYLSEEDIKGSYVDGILKLEIPKEQPVEEPAKLITID